MKDHNIMGVQGQFSSGIKLLIICVMAVLLLIPQLLITYLVNERQDNAQQVRRDIASSWGQEQVIEPPLITIPYTETNDEGSFVRSSLTFHPDTLLINADLKTEIRKRSIYQAVLYRGEIAIEGTYNGISASSFPKGTKEIFWDQASFVQSISDVVGIKSLLNLQVNGQQHELQPAAITGERSGNAFFSTAFPTEQGVQYSYSLTYHLNGSQELRFKPLARQTHVDLRLAWGSPSFVGRFLPDERTVQDTLTTASWDVLYSNTSLPMVRSFNKFSSNYFDFDDESGSTFGVKTLLENDQYRQVNRAVKYAILLIVLTFLTFFFTDSFARANIPLIAYLLTGLALLLFYTLLLSISEYIGFGMAYLIAAVAISVMISLYFWGYVGTRRYAMICAGVLAFMYTFLYIILQMDTFPLLVGSIFLFVVLSVVMYLSRKLEW